MANTPYCILIRWLNYALTRKLIICALTITLINCSYPIKQWLNLLGRIKLVSCALTIDGFYKCDLDRQLSANLTAL
jgi:hypothetical protein